MIESMGAVERERHTRIAVLCGDGIAAPVWVFDSEVSRHNCGTESGEEDGLKLHILFYSC